MNVIALGSYLIAITVVGWYLDQRKGGAESFSCDNERPSTLVAAWSWFPGIILLMRTLL